MDARAEFWAGAKDIVPLAIGVVVYGVAFGLLAAQASMDGVSTGVMGTIVFAGASQIVAVERITAGAGAAAALVAGVALNLRLLLVTASLRSEFQGRPWWQIAFGAHLSSDENWALMHATRRSGRAVGYWYLVGGGATLMVVWILSTVGGVIGAHAIPEPRALGMDFAFTAAFLAILRSLWSGRRDALPWVISAAAVVALTTRTPLDPSWALIAGGVAGATYAGVAG